MTIMKISATFIYIWRYTAYIRNLEKRLRIKSRSSENGEELDLPVQKVPSPLKPDLQSQVKPPYVFVQSAFEWQLWALALHSFTS